MHVLLLQVVDLLKHVVLLLHIGSCTGEVGPIEGHAHNVHLAGWLSLPSCSRLVDLEAPHNRSSVYHGMAIRLQEGCLRWRVCKPHTGHDWGTGDQRILLVINPFSLLIEFSELAANDSSTFLVRLTEPWVL